MARMDTLPEALRLLRESRGLTQTDVAKALGIKPPLVSAWERGTRPIPLDRLGQLADHFDLDLGDLDDALELAGGWPHRSRRKASAPPVELDPRRLARHLLAEPGAIPLDPREESLAKLLEALLELLGAGGGAERD